jgi:cell division protein FtsI/penicillin-binding protein 2
VPDWMGRRGGRGRHRTQFSFEPRSSIFRSQVTSKRWARSVAAVAVLVAALAVLAVAWGIHRSAEAKSRRLLESTTRSYLAAWQRSDWQGMRALVTNPPSTFVETYRKMHEALKVTHAVITPGLITTSGQHAEADFRARLTLAGLGDWSYSGRVALAKVGGQWQVQWTPTAVHPALRGGLRFARIRTWPERAPIVARDGQALTVQGQVVTVGVQLGRIQDRAQVVDAMVKYASVDARTVNAVLDRSGVKPTWFLPVTTLRRSRYEAVKPQLYPVPGIVFQAGTARILLDEGFAQQVIGRVHLATADDLKRLGPPYQAGDTVGAYGLELAYERQLAGTPSGTVELVDTNKKVVGDLYRWVGQDGKRIRTTLDVKMQRAAEAALSGMAQPAALVALDPKTGDIRAAVSRPVDGPERALSGRYPPGSTFKIVTTSALIQNGVALDDVTSCPTQFNAGGKLFTNFEGETFGSLTLREAFEKSCNTAFIQLALNLRDDMLRTAAEGFGFGAKYVLDVPAFGGSFPSPSDDAELAAAAIGQGRVLASPLHMASVAGAASNGVWRLPRLISSDPTISENPLPPQVPGELAELMRLVVTGGTAAGAGLPSDTAGKTGTAEFGTKGQSHAWFVGFRGDVAFAVLVEGGGVGGRVAAPIAADFLNRL